MKTQTELREIAAMCIATYPETTGIAQLSADYLRLTDPTPLTAEHCRAAGLELDRLCKAAFIDNNENESFMVWTDLSEMAVKRPTVGLLYAAQRQEKSR